MIKKNIFLTVVAGFLIAGSSNVEAMNSRRTFFEPVTSQEWLQEEARLEYFLAKAKIKKERAWKAERFFDCILGQLLKKVEYVGEHSLNFETRKSPQVASGAVKILEIMQNIDVDEIFFSEFEGGLRSLTHVFGFEFLATILLTKMQKDKIKYETFINSKKLDDVMKIVFAIKYCLTKEGESKNFIETLKRNYVKSKLEDKAELGFYLLDNNDLDMQERTEFERERQDEQVAKIQVRVGGISPIISKLFLRFC